MHIAPRGAHMPQLALQQYWPEAQVAFPHCTGASSGTHSGWGGQGARMHTTWTSLQCCPAAHLGPVPHWQVPAAPQLSAPIESQAEQAAPPMPQPAEVGGETQVLPAQQPPAQLLESHTQLPETQRWPAVQATPPHVHSPLAEQPSARAASQATQAWPWLPH